MRLIATRADAGARSDGAAFRSLFVELDTDKELLHDRAL